LALVLGATAIGARVATAEKIRADIVDTAVQAGDFKTLAAALAAGDLIDTLKGKGPFTVFAPTDAAFAKIDPATIEKLKTDSDLLTSILTYHVVEGKLTPAELAGTHKTIQGDEVTVEGSGTDFKVNEASVVCGNVQTANATVYIIDSVLMPKS
jgi:uncharacterized surface protein with fasciclin (FAS1) repeats